MFKTNVYLLLLKNQPSCNRPVYQYKDGYVIKNEDDSPTAVSCDDDASDATSETVTSPRYEKHSFIDGQIVAASSTCTQKPYPSSPCGGGNRARPGCGRR